MPGSRGNWQASEWARRHMLPELPGRGSYAARQGICPARNRPARDLPTLLIEQIRTHVLRLAQFLEVAMHLRWSVLFKHVRRTLGCCGLLRLPLGKFASLPECKDHKDREHQE